MIVITSIPFDVPHSEIKASITGAGLPAEYVLRMSLVHDIIKDGGLLIRYPPEVVADAGTQIEAYVEANDYGFATKLENPSIDYSARMLMFARAFDKQVEVTKPGDE